MVSQKKVSRTSVYRKGVWDPLSSQRHECCYKRYNSTEKFRSRFPHRHTLPVTSHSRVRCEAWKSASETYSHMHLHSGLISTVSIHYSSCVFRQTGTSSPLPANLMIQQKPGKISLLTPLSRSIFEPVQRNTAALLTAIQNIPCCCWLVLQLTRLAVQPYKKPL